MNPCAKFFLAAGICLTLLSGCGQRGPLFLPDKTTAETQTPQPVETPDPEAENNAAAEHANSAIDDDADDIDAER